MKPLVLAMLLIVALSVLTGDASGKSKNQSGEWDSVSPGQTKLLLQGTWKVSYDKDGSVLLLNKFVIGQCSYHADYPDEARVYVSSISPKRGLFVILCWEDGRGGKAAWIIDSKDRSLVAKDVVPDGWGIASWVSWSPSEDFALFHAVGEVTMGDMVFVNLVTGKSQEIHYKDFTNNRPDTQDRVQDFNRDAIVWLNPISFHLNLDVRCNRYDGDTCDYERVLSSHPARVTLNPFSISYVNTAQARDTRVRQSPPARKTGKGIRSVDFRNFSYQRESKSTSNMWRQPVDAGTIVLRNGRSMEGEAAMLEPYSELSSIKYVDFDGDGVEEALVAIHTTMMVAGVYEEDDYFVFAYRNGAPIQIFHEYRYKSQGVRVVGKSLVVSAPFWREQDPHTSPYATEITVYQWRRNKFVRVSRNLKRMR